MLIWEKKYFIFYDDKRESGFKNHFGTTSFGFLLLDRSLAA